jgi:TonB family protein
VSNGAAASSERSERATTSALRSAEEHQHRAVPARSFPEVRATKRDGLRARIFGVIGMSLGTHMALLAALGFMPKPELDMRKTVEMEIEEPAPPPPPPPPAAEEPPPKAAEEAPPPKPVAPKIAAPKPAAAPAPPQEAKPAAEAPVDLTGVTLTGDDGASWSSVVGNGEAIQGPAARIGKVTGNDKSGARDGVVGGKGNAPTLVPEASLSRRPVPPEGMDALLEQHFPPRARAQGVSGSAMLRVRILSDGRASDMQIVRETGDYGFGNACMKALRQRRWQPPLDKRGQPVSTEIRYSCEFEVSY